MLKLFLLFDFLGYNFKISVCRLIIYVFDIFFSFFLFIWSRFRYSKLRKKIWSNLFVYYTNFCSIFKQKREKKVRRKNQNTLTAILYESNDKVIKTRTKNSKNAIDATGFDKSALDHRQHRMNQGSSGDRRKHKIIEINFKENWGNRQKKKWRRITRKWAGLRKKKGRRHQIPLFGVISDDPMSRIGASVFSIDFVLFIIKTCIVCSSAYFSVRSVAF